MFQSEYDRFKMLMSDLCVAFDRPATEDRVRVFWEVLKPFSLSVISAAIKARIAQPGKFPTPYELKPTVNTYNQPKAPEHEWPAVHRHAQKCLHAFLCDRGAASSSSLAKLIAAKNKIALAYEAINKEDKTLTGTEIRDRLFAEFKKLWEPMPETEVQQHRESFWLTQHASNRLPFVDLYD